MSAIPKQPRTSREMMTKQVGPIRITLNLQGPPSWYSTYGWTVGEASDRTVDGAIEEVARLFRETLPRLEKGRSSTGLSNIDPPLLVSVGVWGPCENAAEETFGAGKGGAVDEKAVRGAVQKVARLLRKELPRMERAWSDVQRYREWMREQEEARRRRDPLRVAGLTTTEILRGFLEADFAEGWFNAPDVQDAFRKVHGPISLRSVSACIARLHRDGVLERGGNPRRWAYRVHGSKGPSHPGSREIVLP